MKLKNVVCKMLAILFWLEYVPYFLFRWENSQVWFYGNFLCMGSANERRRYYVTPSLIGEAHTQNDPCSMPSYHNYFIRNHH